MQYDQDWENAIKNLAGNPYFQKFMEGVAALREDAICEAEMLENVSDEHKTCALIGKSKALREIIDLYGDYLKQTNVD